MENTNKRLKISKKCHTGINNSYSKKASQLRVRRKWFTSKPLGNIVFPQDKFPLT